MHACFWETTLVIFFLPNFAQCFWVAPRAAKVSKELLKQRCKKGTRKRQHRRPNNSQKVPPTPPQAYFSSLVVGCGGFQQHGFPQRTNMILTIGRSEKGKERDQKESQRRLKKGRGKRCEKEDQRPPKGRPRSPQNPTKRPKGSRRGADKSKKSEKKDGAKKAAEKGGKRKAM